MLGSLYTPDLVRALADLGQSEALVISIVSSHAELRLSVVRCFSDCGSQAVSEEKAVQKLYHTLNE
jgi:hypothetical protein